MFIILGIGQIDVLGTIKTSRIIPQKYKHTLLLDR